MTPERLNQLHGRPPRRIDNAPEDMEAALKEALAAYSGPKTIGNFFTLFRANGHWRLRPLGRYENCRYTRDS